MALLRGIERPITRWRHARRAARDVAAAIRSGLGPVIVYSTQKTASTSVFDALTAAGGVHAFHLHYIHPKHFTTQDVNAKPVIRDGIPLHDDEYAPALWREVIEARLPARFISLVREPVATNVSYFFFGLQRWLNLPRQPDPADYSLAELMRIFLESFPHEGAVRWFERELEPTLRIDVYRQPFPFAAQSQHHENGPWKLLVLRTDMADERKAAAISAFLGREVPPIPHANRADERKSPYRYDEIRAAMQTHPEYVNRLLDDRFTRHFFSAAEIEAIRAKWLAV
jgi:hypothetical protein